MFQILAGLHLPIGTAFCTDTVPILHSAFCILHFPFRIPHSQFAFTFYFAHFTLHFNYTFFNFYFGQSAVTWLGSCPLALLPRLIICWPRCQTVCPSVAKMSHTDTDTDTERHTHIHIKTIHAKVVQYSFGYRNGISIWHPVASKRGCTEYEGHVKPTKCVILQRDVHYL